MALFCGSFGCARFGTLWSGRPGMASWRRIAIWSFAALRGGASACGGAAGRGVGGAARLVARGVQGRGAGGGPDVPQPPQRSGRAAISVLVPPHPVIAGPGGPGPGAVAPGVVALGAGRGADGVVIYIADCGQFLTMNQQLSQGIVSASGRVDAQCIQHRGLADPVLARKQGYAAQAWNLQLAYAPEAGDRQARKPALDGASLSQVVQIHSYRRLQPAIPATALAAVAQPFRLGSPSGSACLQE